MATDLSKLTFDSRENYLKRSEFVGQTSITLAGSAEDASVSVFHSLTYIPFFIVGVDLDDDGVIWSNDKVNERTESSRFFITTPYLKMDYWSTTTALTVNILNSSDPVQTGTRKVYYGVYLDYGS